MNTQQGDLKQIESITLNLDDALELAKLGWDRPTIFAWHKGDRSYIAPSATEGNRTRIAYTPTAAELLDELPNQHSGHYLRIGKRKTKSGHTGYDVGYWNTQDNSYEFFTSSPAPGITGNGRLVEALGGMWAWLNGPEPPEKT